MKRITKTALFAGMALASSALLAGNPLITDVFTADPAPLVDGDTVYLYTTHDEAPPRQWLVMNDWLCYSSKDMVNWKAHGPVASKDTFEWGTHDAWAAQTIKKDGKYWLYVTLCGKGQYSGRAIGVAVSDKPEGPFKDAIGKPLVWDSMTPGPVGWDDMDPTIFIDDDGTPWLAWGHTMLYVAKLKPNMIELDGEIRMMRLPNYTEGPWLFKRNGVYYMIYVSHILNGFNEMASYATATSMEGPWTPRGIMCRDTKNSNCIHPGVAEFKGNWYFFYLNGALTLANGEKGDSQHRSVCLDYMYFNPDGTIQMVEQTDKGTEAPPKTAEQIAAAVPKGEIKKLEPFPKVYAYGGNPTPKLRTVTEMNELTWTGRANTFGGLPVMSTMKTPFRDCTARTGFYENGGCETIGQTFVAPSNMMLHTIELYVGDGEITREQPQHAIKIALYDITGTDPNADTYTVGENLFKSVDGREPEFIYTPQGPDKLLINLGTNDGLGADKVPLKEGHTYVFELQAPRRTFPISWFRSEKDLYPQGAAYRNRRKITNRERTSGDFAFAIYPYQG